MPSQVLSALAFVSLLAAASCGSPGNGDKYASGHHSSPDTGVDTAIPDWPSEPSILDHVRVVDASGVRESAAVVLAGDTIWAVTDAGQDWPQDANVHDYAGATVIPGFIDAHVHLFHSGSPTWVGDTLAANLQADLAWGVVGVADVGSPVEIFDLRDRIAEGTIVGPRIWATGPMLTAVGSHPCETSNDRALCRFIDGDGAAAVAELARADGIKVVLADADFTDQATPRLDLGDLAEIAAAAGTVLAHVDEEDDALDALAAGVDVLAHPVFASDLATTPDAPVHSTIGAFSGTTALLDGTLLAEDLSATPAGVVAVWQALFEHPEEFSDGWPEASVLWAGHARHNIALAVSEGRTVVTGTDSGYWFVPHGVALHRELSELVAAGMTPIEALTAATATPAALLGWHDLGLVAAGYRADFVVVAGRPDEDITAARDIVRLWLGGQPYRPDDAWVAAGDGGFCLDDRDCTDSVCDLVDHRCRGACETPGAVTSACGADSWCMAADALDTTSEAVCHPGDGCDLYSQDCSPDWYVENCVPADLDTNLCWPSGPREAGWTCSWVDPEFYCAQGLLCSTVDARCYELCDPGDAGTCPGCTWQTDDGVDWFGLCL